MSFGEEILSMIQKMDAMDLVQCIKHNHLHSLKINHNCDTLLHLASQNGNFEIVKTLIEAGSDVNSQNKLGKTPILLAIENKPKRYLRVVEILCESKADIHIADVYGKSPAQIVLSGYDHSYTFAQLFFLKIIHDESMNNSQLTAQKLIKLNYPLYEAVSLCDAKLIEDMIKLGSQVNRYHPTKKFTALSKAVQLMNLDIIKVLIKFGADVDLADTWGALPIAHYFCFIPNSTEHTEIIKLFLDKTVLLKDLHKGNRIYQLKKVIEYGSKEIIQLLLGQHNDLLNIEDRDGQTPLHYICGNYHSNITEVLQGQKIDVNVKDALGRTPLYVATASSFAHINTLKFLLQNGANVNITTRIPGSETPLFCLCQNHVNTRDKYFEILDMFIQYGLNIQFVEPNQKTVFDLNMVNKRFYMAQPLLAHLAILDERKKPVTENIRNKINSHSIFNTCFHDCKVELEQMKDKIINKKLTLYMIIVDQLSDEQIAKNCRFSAESVSNFQKLKSDFYSDYHYYTLVQKRISSITLKIKLFQEASHIICELFESKINASHLVITEILDYLNDQDLQNLINVECNDNFDNLRLLKTEDSNEQPKLQQEPKLNDNKIMVSRLNPDAEEFVPRWHLN